MRATTRSEKSTSGLIVLGPFRSGTSLTCRMLARLGVDFGPGDGLWRADRYNPGGFYERLDVNHANGRLLESIGRTIVDPVDPLEPLRRADRSVLAEADLSWRAEGWGLKDPRLCTTLATWVEAGLIDPAGLRLVIVHRRLEDVVRSSLAYPTLCRLLGADAARARLLAEHCDRVAAWHAERLGCPVLEIGYERLLVEPLVVAGELARFVDVECPTRIRAAASEVGKRRALRRYYAEQVNRRLMKVLPVRRPGS